MSDPLDPLYRDRPVVTASSTQVERFRRAWYDYQNNIGKTRTIAGVYLMAVKAEEEEIGSASEFMKVWNKRREDMERAA